MTHDNNKGSGLGKMVMGLGAVAAGIGLYFFYGSKNGERRRKEVKGWMLRMRGEVLEELEDLKEVSKDAYFNIVDKVKERYHGMKNVDESELEDVADEMKEGWDDVADTIEGDAKDVVDEVKDVAGEVRKPRLRKKKMD